MTTPGAGVLDWWPYANRNEANFCLSRFTDAALGTDIGIVWATPDACMLLRKPRLDADGYGDALIASWHAAPPQATHASGWWQRFKNAAKDALTQIGEAQLAEAEANQAMSEAMVEAVGGWLGNKDHEHQVGLAFDVIGLVAFALLFVPGVGEAEMAFMALGAAARTTAVLAGTGAMCGLVADGNYLRLRYGPGGTAAAEDWDNSPEATTLSLAAAVLALPDFAVGGVMTVRDLRALPSEMSEARETASGLRATSETQAAKAARLRARESEVPDWHARKLESKAAGISSRAERIAARAKETELRSSRLRTKLIVALGLNAPATFVGTPAAELYYGSDLHHDHPHDLGANVRTAGGYLGDQGGKLLRAFLDPPSAHDQAHTSRSGGLGLRIGGTGQEPR